MGWIDSFVENSLVSFPHPPSAIGCFMIDALKILIICIFIDVGLSSIVTDFPVWPLYLMLVLIAAVIVVGIIASVRAR